MISAFLSNCSASRWTAPCLLVEMGDAEQDVLLLQQVYRSLCYQDPSFAFDFHTLPPLQMDRPNSYVPPQEKYQPGFQRWRFVCFASCEKTSRLNCALCKSAPVLMSEVCAHFFPRMVELHNYTKTNAASQKKVNWNTLNSEFNLG